MKKADANDWIPEKWFFRFLVGFFFSAIVIFIQATSDCTIKDCFLYAFIGGVIFGIVASFGKRILVLILELLKNL